MNRRKLIGSMIGLPGVLSLGGLLKMFPVKPKGVELSPGVYTHNEIFTVPDVDWQYIDREMQTFMHLAYDKSYEPSTHLFNAIKEYLKHDIELVDRGRTFSAPDVGIHSYYEYSVNEHGTNMISFNRGAVPYNIERVPLKVQWTPEFAQDIRAFQPLQPETELGRILVEYVGMELKLRRAELTKNGKILCWGIGLTPTVMMPEYYTPRKGMYMDIEK